jgi:glycosyltransferase involved in cell wall biosynthesis
MKKLLPNWLKFPFWYIFKSPQRELGSKSVYLDLLGIFRFLLVQTLPFKKSTKLSICVGNLNRNAMILNYLLPSLNKLVYKENIELVLVDFGSDNFEELKENLEDRWAGRLNIISLKEPFTRSRAINVAVAAASEELLFIADADFSLPKNLIELCYRYTLFNSIWFPIVFYLYKDKPERFGKGNGEWMQWGGKGILSIKRSKFLEMNGLSEKYKSWGGEDEEFWFRCHQNGEVVIRSRCRELLHHWHPSFNPKYNNL